MATLTVSVPDDVLRDAEANMAREHLEDLLVRTVRAVATGGLPVDPETEAALLEGLDSPLEEMTDADWARLHARADSRDDG